MIEYVRGAWAPNDEERVETLWIDREREMKYESREIEVEREMREMR